MSLPALDAQHHGPLPMLRCALGWTCLGTVTSVTLMGSGLWTQPG